MKPQLRSITIADFRSLRGTVTVPLHAPVVLIHGPNGAGKTSVLSAIELALTGELQAMRRSDPNYEAYLPHRGSNFGTISLTTTGVTGDALSRLDIVVRSSGLEGAPLLAGDIGRFFSERCYLAQATLSRLLEIYQHAKTREDSPLTRFVKDLLGLDQLDALIEGLQPVGDVRNTRKLVPEYAAAEEARQSIQLRLADSKAVLERLRGEVATLNESVGRAILSIQSVIDGPLSRYEPSAVEAFLTDNKEERGLIALSGVKRDLASLRQRSAPLASLPSTADQTSAEVEERGARSALDAWWKAAGNQLEALIGELRATFPDLPSVASTDPESAFKTASERIDAELDRCDRLITQDDLLTTRGAELDHAVERERARIVIVDEELALVTEQAEDLSRALAALVPHIHGDDCPVCGRDYREVSSGSLVAHVSAQVARLMEQADRLQSLRKTRVEAIRDLADAEREREAAASRRLSQDSRDVHKTRIAMLTETKQQLASVADLAANGAAVIRREASARQRLAELRSRDRLSTELRASIAEICAILAQPPLEEGESIADALERLETHVIDQEVELLARQQVRLESLRRFQLLRQRRSEIADLEQTIAQDTRQQQRLDLAFAAAENRRAIAKTLARIAADVRTEIVGRVFNNELNKIWRDLFVRLAPTEPFVPAFRLPQTAGQPVFAQLETIHREGGRGGAPGAMLSSGNLNTAALTLFLALHLSVKPQLPWLILDDSVQSMDEVHIAQFAALLRTLSKEHGRQILIAVHDRPLFDYLALELSPAFQGDQLITVELSRSNEGDTVAEPTIRSWEPDRAVAA